MMTIQRKQINKILDNIKTQTSQIMITIFKNWLDNNFLQLENFWVCSPRQANCWKCWEFSTWPLQLWQPGWRFSLMKYTLKFGGIIYGEDSYDTLTPHLKQCRSLCCCQTCLCNLQWEVTLTLNVLWQWDKDLRNLMIDDNIFRRPPPNVPTLRQRWQIL